VKRFFRIGLAMLVLVFLTFSMVLAVVTFKPILLKPVIERWFDSGYQRRLEITGDIRLTLFPRINLVLNNVSLSEYQRDERFASIESMTLTMPVIPLLSRRLEIDDFYVSGLSVELVRDQNGQFNVDDLLGDSDESVIDTFQITQIKVKNSRLNFRDELTRQSYELDAMQWGARQIETNGVQQVWMNARLSASGVSVTEGNVFAKQMKTQLEVADILFAKEALAISSLVLSLRSDFDHAGEVPVGHFSAQFSMAGLNWNETVLTSQHVHMELDLQHAGKIAQVELDTGLMFKLKGVTRVLPDIHLAFDFFHPDYMRESVHGNFNGFLNMDWPDELLEIGMHGTIDDRAVNTEARFQGFAQPEHSFKLEIDTLDVSTLMSAESPQSSRLVQFDESLGVETDAVSFSRVSWLDETGLNGVIHIGNLLAGDLQFSGIQLKVGKDAVFSNDQPE